MKALVLTYLVLMALAIASLIASSFGSGGVVAFSIAAAKALAIGLVFMELDKAHTVDRTIAAVAVLFVLLLCGGSLADVAFR